MNSMDVPTEVTKLVYTCPLSASQARSQNEAATLLAHYWPAIEQHLRQQIGRELFAERITETPAGWSERYVGGWNDALDAAVDKVRAGGQQ